MTFQHPLGLGQFDWEVMRGAIWALQQVENGHYLPPVSRHKAALRMIGRGYLTDARTERKGDINPGGWVIVCLRQGNVDKYNADLLAAGIVGAST